MALIGKAASASEHGVVGKLNQRKQQQQTAKEIVNGRVGAGEKADSAQANEVAGIDCPIG